MGLRVDIAEIFTFTFLLWILLLIPFKFVLNRQYRAILGIIWGLIIASIIFFNIGDSLYFGFVNRHLSDELNVIGNDVGILFSMAYDFYLLETIFSTVLFITISYVFYKIFTAKIEKQELKHREWFNILLVIIIAFIGIRGKIDGISFGVSDAFAVNKLASGNLALNGFFCYYRGGDKQSFNHSNIELSKAINTIHKKIFSKKMSFNNAQYPFMRTVTNKKANNYNIVVIMIESLSAKYLDSLSNNNYKVTPYLDYMAKNGLLFTKFYANGQRSLDGITSTFTSTVLPAGFENFGEGLELYNLSYLGDIANKNGYTTLSIQSSNRGSFRVDKLSALAGFKNYYGAEDIPRVGKEKGNAHFGTWDGNMLKFLLNKVDKLQEPFLSFAFTASTHAPYYSPGKEWEKYPHSTKTEEGFLNTLNYVDRQIKEFMQNAEKKPWFDKTIFIFTADHVNHAKLDAQKQVMRSEKTYLKAFHIPLIIYAPKIFKASKLNTIGSQVDITPTIIDILNLNGSFSGINNSLLDETVLNRVAFTKQGTTISLTDGKGAVHYNFNSFIDGEGNMSKELKELLLSIDTAQAQLLKTSKWMK